MKLKNDAAPLSEIIDRHILYEASVQSTETEIAFLKKVYKSKHGETFRTFREDFCGTCMMACEWVEQHKKNRVWCVDWDRPTLDWARDHRVAALGKAASRVELVCENVLTAALPPVDVLVAFNFSFNVFKERETLRQYFRRAYDGVNEDGMFVVDVFGGTGAGSVKKDKRTIASFKTESGERIPKFKYVWDQAEFNPIDHHILCHIHFQLPDGSRIEPAFTYDWRLWTLPEIQEILGEAGFRQVDVYIHDFDENGESDDIWLKRTECENALGWIAYVVAWK